MDKKLLFGIFLFLILTVSLISVYSLPDEWGRAVKEGAGDQVIIEIKQVTPLERLLASIFIVRGLQGSYEQGQSVEVTQFQELRESCNGPTFVMFEVYNAPTNQQTRDTYQERLSTPSLINEGNIPPIVGPGIYQARAGFTVPLNANIGTWSISSYVYCPSKDPRPSAGYSEVNEINFEVTGEPQQCTNDEGCNFRGKKGCTDADGIRQGWVKTCGNYDNDICFEWETRKENLEFCGGVDTCREGKCIDGESPGENETPIIKVISRSVEIGQAQILGKISLRNDGVDMDESYVAEMQVILAGDPLQSIINPPQGQTNCDPKTLRNVHQEFKLLKGQSKTIEFVSPQKLILSNAEYDVFFVLRKDCANIFQRERGAIRDCPPEDDDCNLIVSDPEAYGNDDAVRLPGYEIINSGIGDCGDNECEEEEENICVEDCEVECTDDNFCDSLEFNKGTCIDCIGQKCIKPRLIFGCAESFTKEEYSRNSESQNEAGVCLKKDNCNPRSGHFIECASGETAGVIVPRSWGSKFADFLLGQDAGLCLATPEGEEKTECSDFIKGVGIIKISSDDCTNGYVFLGGLILLLIIILAVLFKS